MALLYDDRYLPAGDYLAILGISTAFAIVTRPMEAVQVASGRQRAAIEFNVLRLICLGIGAALALARSDPMALVFALGLLEVPAYCYGLLKMARLQQVRWHRELTFLATVAAGFVVGWTGKIAAFRLFGHPQFM